MEAKSGLMQTRGEEGVGGATLSFSFAYFISIFKWTNASTSFIQMDF
jgi:hypothetical protein